MSHTAFTSAMAQRCKTQRAFLATTDEMTELHRLAGVTNKSPGKACMKRSLVQDLLTKIVKIAAQRLAA